MTIHSVYHTSMTYLFNISRDDYVRIGNPVTVTSEWYDGPDRQHQLEIKMYEFNFCTIIPNHLVGPNNDIKGKYSCILISERIKILNLIRGIRKLGYTIDGEGMDFSN